MADAVINKRKPHLWWNQPWTLVEGCTRCSAGCADCWALENEKRYGKAVEGGGIRFREDRLDCPQSWRKPRVVAVWNDLFHKDVPAAFRLCAFAQMMLTPWHTYLILTKRRGTRKAFYERWRDEATTRRYMTLQVGMAMDALRDASLPFSAKAANDWYLEHCDQSDRGRCDAPVPWPLPNVWLGVTCESNDYLWRVEELVRTPAAVRWVNAHLLGPLDLNRRPGGSSDPRSYLPERAYAGLDGWYCVVCKQWVPYTERKQDHVCDNARVRWVAIECNRPFRGDPKEWWGWCCDLVDQCVMKGVPVWVKQGPTAAGRVSHDYADFPEWARRREFPNQEQADAQE